MQLWLFQLVSRPLLQAPDKLQGCALSHAGPTSCLHRIYRAVTLLGQSFAQSHNLMTMPVRDAGQDRQHFMLTTMDTLDSASLGHASPAKGGEIEEMGSLPAPVAAEQGHATSTFLLASLPSRLGALWTSAEPGESAKHKHSHFRKEVLLQEGSYLGQACCDPGTHSSTVKLATMTGEQQHHGSIHILTMACRYRTRAEQARSRAAWAASLTPHPG